MTKRLLTTSLAAVICLLGAAGVAHAGTVTFTFDTLSGGGSKSLTNPSGDSLDNSIIQTYMTNVLTANCATCSMSVGGAASVDHGYTGDGHVVGGPSGATSAPSITLGTNDYVNGSLAASTTTGTGSSDNFIKNYSPNTFFSFSFTGLTIQSVSFDYEIFPDGTCTALTTAACGGTGYPNRPDLTFSTNIGTVFHYYGNTPSGSYKESPCSDTSSLTACVGTVSTGNELAPQLIGTTGLLGVGGATTLTFTDWPATIGIDNLTITFTNGGGGGGGQSAVPEPASMLLLGTGLATVAARRRKKNRKA